MHLNMASQQLSLNAKDGTERGGREREWKSMYYEFELMIRRKRG